MNPIQIFRTGRHTDMSGTVAGFSEADLAAMAAVYDPALSEAPIVVGHPKSDAPAYGWIKGLKAEGGALYAEPDQVDPAFAELVRSGRYKKLSACFYAPQSAANPKPGAYYLRHVGFLGAQPPAIKGLAPVQFAEGEEGLVTVEFSEGESLSLAARLIGLLRGVRDYITEKDGTEKAEAVLPGYALDSLQERAAVALASPVLEPVPGFSEPEPNKENTMDKPTHTEQETELARREAELARREAAFAERERLADAQTVVDAAIKEGRLTPAQSAGLAAFMAHLSPDDSLEFAEGDRKTSPDAFMRDFLSRLPKQVAFAEHSAPTGEADELEPAEAAQRAVAYQERQRRDGVIVTTTDAMAAVKAGKDKE